MLGNFLVRLMCRSLLLYQRSSPDSHKIWLRSRPFSIQNHSCCTGTWAWIMIEYLAFCYEIFEEWNLYESNISDCIMLIYFTHSFLINAFWKWSHFSWPSSKVVFPLNILMKMFSVKLLFLLPQIGNVNSILFYIF